MPDLLVTPKPEEKAEILVTPKPEGKGSILVTPKPEIKLEDLILTMGEAEFKEKFGLGDEVDLKGIKSRFPDAEDNHAKIWGKEQVTGGKVKDYAHGEESLRIAEELAKNPDVKVIMLNRGINRYLDKDGKLLPGNTRPDVSYLTKDGKVHQVEVQSRTDYADQLQARMKETQKKLPEEMHGGATEVIERF